MTKTSPLPSAAAVEDKSACGRQFTSAGLRALLDQEFKAHADRITEGRREVAAKQRLRQQLLLLLRAPAHAAAAAADDDGKKKDEVEPALAAANVSPMMRS